MVKTLQNHFSIIRDRREVLLDIHSQPHLLEKFKSWEKEHQELFLDYCTGVRGVKILYDRYFKMFLNPEVKPERLEAILSLILGQKVKILQILPNESTSIGAEKSLLVLDIVVRLEDGSIANVEVQKIGYAFPGQRSACYSSDLLMRQYKYIKETKKKKFRYSDIKKVYTIIFFETSTREFHQFPNTYMHRSSQRTDTGLQIDLLQEYVFIALDIFKENLHNKGIDKDNKLEAWLTFLCEDDPEWILKLIEAYPEFGELYQEIYKMCRNTEAMMGLFSEELLEMDRNTVDFMIDEMQDTIDELQAQNDNWQAQYDEIQAQRDEAQAQNIDLQTQLAQKDALIAELLAKQAKK